MFYYPCTTPVYLGYLINTISLIIKKKKESIIVSSIIVCNCPGSGWEWGCLIFSGLEKGYCVYS